ncbi:MAG: hypothetical protein ACYDDO_01375 [Acidiferrobacterales bacterium]
MTRITLASALLYGTSGFGFVYGFIDLLTPRILPYHERFLGLSHADLPPKISILLLSALRIIGVLLIGISTSLAVVVHFAFSAHQLWSWWLLLIAWLAILVPLFFITRRIDSHAPWKVTAVLIAVVVTAMLLSRSEFAAH